VRDFEYDAPATLAEAVAVFQEHNGRARPLAGGTDLIDHVRTGRLEPDVIVDVKQIPELNVLECSSDGLRLGAAVPCYKIYEHEQIQASYSAIADSCHIIGGIQIQNRATVGGNVCNASPAADASPSLIALEATCVIAGPQGTRELPVEEFFSGPGRNVLQPGELLVELKLPAPSQQSGSHYRRFIPRNEMDIAVVGVGAAVTLDEAGQLFERARVGLGAVAPTPLLVEEVDGLLQGQPVNEESIERAASAARSLAKPIDDMRGTVEFRKHVAGVLTRRVLWEAVARARGDSAR